MNYVPVTVGDIKDMVGKTFTSVKVSCDTMTFENETERYQFYHCQDCCEAVGINDITGDLEDLQGSPLLIAEAKATVAIKKMEESRMQQMENV